MTYHKWMALSQEEKQKYFEAYKKAIWCGNT